MIRWHVPFSLERIWWEERVFKTWNWFSTTFPSMVLPRKLQASGATNFWRSLWETHQLRSGTLQCIPGYKQVQFHNDTDFWNTVLTNSAPTDIIINVIYFKFFLFRTWLTIETTNFLPCLKKLKQSHLGSGRKHTSSWEIKRWTHILDLRPQFGCGLLSIYWFACMFAVVICSTNSL